MSERDWNKMFDSIVESLDMSDRSEPQYENLTPFDVSRAITGINEVATYLGRYLLQCMNQEDTPGLPEGVGVFVRELTMLSEEVSEILSDCMCPECRGCDCPLDDICDDCLRDLGEF